MGIIASTPHHMALVYDEYGHFEGIVTSGDILEAITGAFSQDETEEQAMVQRPDGSYLVAGWTPVDEFIDVIRVPIDPDPDYTTIAGFVLALTHGQAIYYPAKAAEYPLFFSLGESNALGFNNQILVFVRLHLCQHSRARSGQRYG